MTLKKKMTLGFLGVVLLGAGYLGIKTNQYITNQKLVIKRIKKLPDLPLYSVSERKNKNLKQLLVSKPLVIVYFNTDCHFCQGEIKNLEQHSKRLQNIDFVFISDQPFDKISDFIKAYRMSDYTSWKIMRDSLHQFHSIFGTKLYPNTYIYSNKGKLLGHFMGEISAKAIRKVITKAKQVSLVQ